VFSVVKRTPILRVFPLKFNVKTPKSNTTAIIAEGLYGKIEQFSCLISCLMEVTARIRPYTCFKTNKNHHYYY